MTKPSPEPIMKTCNCWCETGRVPYVRQSSHLSRVGELEDKIEQITKTDKMNFKRFVEANLLKDAYKAEVFVLQSKLSEQAAEILELTQEIKLRDAEFEGKNDQYKHYYQVYKNAQSLITKQAEAIEKLKEQRNGWIDALPNTSSTLSVVDDAEIDEILNPETKAGI